MVFTIPSYQAGTRMLRLMCKISLSADSCVGATHTAKKTLIIETETVFREMRRYWRAPANADAAFWT